MAAVATRGAVGLLAVAKRHFCGFVHHDLLGPELASFVGAITEWLPFGIATSTPIVSSRRQFDDRRSFIRYVSFAHKADFILYG